MRAAAPLAFVLLLAGAPPARADEPRPVAGPDAAAAAARAEELIRVGVELRREGKEREALERFREAHRLNPSPRALGQMGLAAKSLRRYVDAEQYLETALASADNPWVQQNREALELARDVVAKQLASLMVTSNVEGSELFLNGTRVAKLPLERPMRVEAGSVRIEVRAPAHDPADAEETVPAGQTLEVRVELNVAPTPVQPPPFTMPAKPDDARPALLPWILVAGGVGVGGIAVGTIFGLRALSLKKERDAACPEGDIRQCPDSEGVQLDEQARGSALASTVGFAVGGVALGTAGILLAIELATKPSPRAPRVTGGPTASGGFVGARLAF